LETTDNLLIEEIKKGSMKSFDSLMIKYQVQVYRLAFGFAKDKESAMDITQNVFIKVYEHLNKFQGKSQFKTWLTRIVFNESQNWVKKNRKHYLNDDLEGVSMIDNNSPDQEGEYLARENKAILLRSLYELNTKHRLAVILRYFENYSVKEIAATLNCSEGVVKNILFRSLKKLRSNLASLQIGEMQ